MQYWLAEFPETLRRRDPPRLIFAEQLGRRTPAGLILEIDTGERLAVVVPHDEAGIGGGKRRVA